MLWEIFLGIILFLGLTVLLWWAGENQRDSDEDDKVAQNLKDPLSVHCVNHLKRRNSILNPYSWVSNRSLMKQH